MSRVFGPKHGLVNTGPFGVRFDTPPNVFEPGLEGDVHLGWTPLMMVGCDIWLEYRIPAWMGTVIDPIPDPDVYVTVPNLGLWHGFFSSAVGKRPFVTYLLPAGVSVRVAQYDGGDDIEDLAPIPAAVVKTQQAWTWVIVLSPVVIRTGVLFDTRSGAGPGVRLELTVDLGFVWTLWNAGGVIATYSTATHVLTLNEASVIVISYSAAAGWEVRLNNAVLSSGALGGVVSAAAPAGLSIGSMVGGGDAGEYDVGVVLGYERVLTDAEKTFQYNWWHVVYMPVDIDYVITNDGYRVLTNAGDYVLVR